jgi:hypothetical protein
LPAEAPDAVVVACGEYLDAHMVGSLIEMLAQPYHDARVSLIALWESEGSPHTPQATIERGEKP